MKKVSVVIPLYNVEDCMESSIRSVLDQTYPYTEILLIDDGSPDNSGRIAEQFKRRYPDKIEVYHQKNAGGGGARNTGVRHATGDYLLFVDSDDTIAPTLLEECVAVAEKEQADIVAFEYSMVRPDGSVIKVSHSPFDFSPVGSIQQEKKYLLLQAMPWNKLFSMSFYKESGLDFPVKVWYEDFIACTKIMILSKKIAYVDKPFYRYCVRQNTIMRNKNVERNREIFSAMEDILCFFTEKGLAHEYADELCYLAVDNIYITASLRLIRMGETGMLPQLQQYVAAHFPHYRKNPYIRRMSKQYRLTFWLLEHHAVWAIRALAKLKDRA